MWENNLKIQSQFSLEPSKIPQIWCDHFHENLCLSKALQHFRMRLKFLVTKPIANVVNQILQVHRWAGWCENDDNNCESSRYLTKTFLLFHRRMLVINAALNKIKNYFYLRLQYFHCLLRFCYTNFRFHSTCLQCNFLCHVPVENRSTDWLNRQKMSIKKPYKTFEALMARLISRIFPTTTDWFRNSLAWLLMPFASRRTHSVIRRSAANSSWWAICLKLIN